jgi:hypothetical protein
MSINTPGIGYPIFEANQVLKYTDLNSLFDYLDNQQRLTRTHLIGMGIVCGLESSVNLSGTPAAIALSPGFGLTSEGYLLALGATQLTHYQPPRPVPTQLFAPTPTAATENLSFYTVMELFEQEGDQRRPLSQDAEGRDRTPASLQAALTDQVLVVLYEPQDQQRDSCLIDCDDRGKDRSFRLRFFLLPRTQTEDAGLLTAEHLLRQGYGLDQLPEPWRSQPTDDIFTARYRFFQEFNPRVRRFGYIEETITGVTAPAIRLDQMKTYDQLCQSYYEVCEQAIGAIATAFPQLFRLFSPLLTHFQPNPSDFNALGTQLLQRLQKIWSPQNSDPSTLETVEAQYALQYFYDYLSQLVAAYAELAHAAFDLMEDCEPDLRRFPKFLMLGIPLADSAPCAVPSAYRSHFVQPPLYNGNALRVKQVRHLYERLVRLCAADSFLLLPFYDTPLKITPSKDRSVPLSQQAIPYYLNYPNLYLYWSYEACRKGISDRHPAYFYPLSTGTPINSTDDLVHRLDAYSFYRIEGHIGEGNRNALEQIRTYQQRYSLPFDILVLKLGTSASLQDLNISGQLDDLEADFGRMKDKFSKLWEKNQERWSQNALLNTLKRVFFEQSSLSAITYTQLFNSILALASESEHYRFTEVAGAAQQYRLSIINAQNTEIAQYTLEGAEAPTPIDFSGLSSEGEVNEIEQEQRRIANEFATCFALRKVRYGTERQEPNNPLSYHLRLSVEDEFDLPREPNTGRPRGTAPITLRSLSFFSVSFDSNNQSTINQTEFQDFETLYGLLRDVPEDATGQQKLPFSLGDRQAADSLNYFEFKGLMEVYQQRLEKLMELHLFHKFAELHPGMEHLGGVPKGGTFILVYVDGEEVVSDLLGREREVGVRSRTPAIRELATFPSNLFFIAAINREALNRADIVVADFCLPYRCCSTTPAVSYILAQPRPIVLLEKTAFCEDDETSYEFLLDPPGGLLKGEGSYQEGNTYYFQPSRIEQDVITELAITFTYVVEGAFDTFTVVLYPEPIAELSIEAGESFCNDAPPIPLRLSEGTDPAIELLQITINEEVVEQLVPSRYAQNGEPETLELVARLRDRRTNCENTITRTATIHPSPNAEFQFDPAPNDSGGYCAEGGEQGNAVVFVPEEPEFSSGFEIVEDGERSQANSIFLDDYSRIRNPVILTVIHTAQRADCSSEEQKQITIFPIPDANFSLSADQVCSNGEPIDITLNPNDPDQPRGRLEAFGPDGQLIPDAVQAEQFIPAAVNLGDANSQRVRIIYTTEGEGGCTNQSDRTITVHQTPAARFDVRTVLDNSDGARVEVSNIQPEEASNNISFQWETPGGSREPENSRNQPFTVIYQPIDTNRNVTITLTVTSRIGRIRCASTFTQDIEFQFEEPIVRDNPSGGNPRGGIVDGGIVDNRLVRPLRDEGTNATAILNQRLENYRESAASLRRDVRVRDSITADQFAERFLTLDRTLDETEATNQYEERTRPLLELHRQLPEERQPAISQLIALSTASLLDRLVIGTLTDEMISRLQEIFNGFREAEIPLSLLRSTWNPEALVGVPGIVNLDSLDQLIQ